MSDPYDDVDPADDAGVATPSIPIARGPQQAPTRSYADVMAQRQAIVEQTRGMLDKTIQEMRDKHSGAGPGQLNLPLLAFASGLLKTRPGVAGNFATELGEGLSQMGAAVSRKRMNDSEFTKGVADLQTKSAQLADVPLRDLQKELAAVDVAGIRGNRPLINSTTGVTVFPNHFGAGDHGVMRPGSQDIVRASDIAGGNRPTPIPGTGVLDDDIKFLQEAVHSDIKPGSMVKDIKFDKLAEVARRDPALAKELWDLINYDQDIKAITTSRGSKYEARDLLRQAKEIDETFRPGMYENVKKARLEWEGTGRQMNNQAQLQKTLNHMADALGAAAALENGDAQMINAAKNKIKEWSGDAAPTNIKAVADILSKEMAKYFAGAGGTSGVEERRDLANILSAARSPQQLQGAIRYGMSLVRGQAEPLAAAKQVAFGNRKKVTMEDLLDESSRHSFEAVTKHDITTPEGRKALLARLPAVTNAPGGAKTWPRPSAAANDLLKKDPVGRGAYEEIFGPGSAAMVLGQ